MPTPENMYELGRLAGIQEAHNSRLTDIESKVDVLIGFMERSKGGFMVLLKVGAISASLSVGVSAFVQWAFKALSHS